MSSREFDMSPSEFAYLSDLAFKLSGIVLEEKKRDMVYGRITRRIRALKLDSFAEYCNILKSDNDDEIKEFTNAITTNLTHFFRENHHFEHLHDWLSADKSLANRRLRIWSAGCSSGMEPYSIAMLLHRLWGAGASSNAKILATDIDSAILAKAKAGVYSSNELEKLESVYQKYILDGTAPETKQVREDLKELIAFKCLNLLEGWPMKGPFDAIFCRNVVIYFDVPTKENVFLRMHKLLAPGGFLYIGHSETMRDIPGYKPVGRTVYQKVAS